MLTASSAIAVAESLKLLHQARSFVASKALFCFVAMVVVEIGEVDKDVLALASSLVYPQIRRADRVEDKHGHWPTRGH
jgi:hypothetical protein